MPSPFVSVIMVNYNVEKYLKKCFHTVAGQDYPKDRLQIIVADNDSKDGSLDYIKKTYKNVLAFNTGGNLGYSGGANFGYKHAKGEYVALMANDMIFPKDWVKKMVGFMEKNKDAAVATCSMVNGEDMSISDGEVLNASPILVGRTDTKRTGYTVVPWGGACIFRKGLFKEPFDSDYFLYGEDTYLGLMSWLRGYKVKSVPLKVAHMGSVTVGFFSKTQVHYNERNRLTNKLIFFRLSTSFFLIPLVVSDILVKLVYFLKIKRPDLVKTELEAIWWNFRNFGKNVGKRRVVQAQRKVGDHVIFDVLCENLYGDGRLKSKLNYFAGGYFRIMKKVYTRFRI